MDITSEKLKKYIEDKDIIVNDIDSIQDDLLDINQVKLAELYLKYYNEFYRIFNDSKIKVALKIIELDKPIYLSISSLIPSEWDSMRGLKKCRLVEYVRKNQLDISNFIHSCKEVFE